MDPGEPWIQDNHGSNIAIGLENHRSNIPWIQENHASKRTIDPGEPWIQENHRSKENHGSKITMVSGEPWIQENHASSDYASRKTIHPGELLYYYKDLFTHKDINTYINGVVKICLNKFFFFEHTGFQKKREKICKIMH